MPYAWPVAAIVVAAIAAILYESNDERSKIQEMLRRNGSAEDENEARDTESGCRLSFGAVELLSVAFLLAACMRIYISSSLWAVNAKANTGDRCRYHSSQALTGLLPAIGEALVVIEIYWIDFYSTSLFTNFLCQSILQKVVHVAFLNAVCFDFFLLVKFSFKYRYYELARILEEILLCALCTAWPRSYILISVTASHFFSSFTSVFLTVRCFTLSSAQEISAKIGLSLTRWAKLLDVPLYICLAYWTLQSSFCAVQIVYLVVLISMAITSGALLKKIYRQLKPW